MFQKQKDPQELIFFSIFHIGHQQFLFWKAAKELPYSKNCNLNRNILCFSCKVLNFWLLYLHNRFLFKLGPVEV